MQSILAVINAMVFCVVFTMAVYKFGYAEDALRHVIKDVVQEELKERFPQVNKPKSWWRENG